MFSLKFQQNLHVPDKKSRIGFDMECFITTIKKNGRRTFLAIEL
jgi:hypothetical protein